MTRKSFLAVIFLLQYREGIEHPWALQASRQHVSCRSMDSKYQMAPSTWKDFKFSDYMDRSEISDDASKGSKYEPLK